MSLRMSRQALVSAVVALSLRIAGTGTILAGASHLDYSSNVVASPSTIMAWATYYGWYDNTPPGCATSYSGCARGTGTYGDPITFASDKREFPVGTILYYPTLEKYLVMGDDCQECDQDWSGHGPDGGPHFRHLDIWTGGKGGNEFAAINCEDALTQSSPKGTPMTTGFIVNPPQDEPVSHEPVLNARTGHCFGGARTSATHGIYQNTRSGQCITEKDSAAGYSAIVAPCASTSSEISTFEGAFFLVRGRCLHLKGSKPGARLDFARCGGGPREQWSVNENGTITWIQYTFCVAEVSGRVQLAKCTGSKAEKWVFKAAA